jgi:outer membrane protein assembly factor BamB
LALDAASGRRLWQAEPQARGVVGNEQRLAVSDRAAILANEETELVEARKLSDGSRLWARQLSNRVVSLGACRGHRLTAVTHRASLGGKTTLIMHALDSRDGKTLWQQPVSGWLAGSGGGHLFVEEPSGLGRLSSQIAAYRCSDGRRVELPQPGTQYTSLQHASREGAVLLFGFNFQRTVQRLCVVHPGRSERSCLEATALAPAGYRLKSAAVQGRHLYVSMGHLVAHNLDPTPDSSVVVYDLVERREVARTEPMVANAGFVDAGSFLLTGIGGTGARDFAHLLDPADGRIVLKLALSRAVTAMAADEQRAYVASYAGQLYAIALPRPGPSQLEARAVKPQPLPAQPSDAPLAGSFDLDRWLTIDAHPPRGVTSGQATDGAIGAVAFVGPKGRWIAAGGNDDRVRVFDLDQQGKRLWQSAALGKDINGLASCGEERIAAQIYGGSIRVYRRTSPASSSFSLLRTIRHPHAWMFGLTGDCQRLVSDVLNPAEYNVYDADTGAKLVAVLAHRRFDRRGTRVRAGRLAYVDNQGAVAVLQVDGAAGATPRWTARLQLPMSVHHAQLVQLFAVDERSLLAEYCASDRCVVRRYDLGARVEWEIDFDISGSVWSATVPSDIDLSPDGAFLTFFRDGMDMSVTRVKTKERRSLGSIRRTMSSTPSAVFSPFDPRLLAVAMHPRPNQLSLIRVRQR